ncbi:hypothetical protein [Seinonella peptonophila]|nr:hypothetical protein [Seinonella peptonophila]
MSVFTIFAILSFSGISDAATVITKKEVTISYGEETKSTAPVYLYAGQILGVYVDISSTSGKTHWFIRDSNNIIIKEGTTDANFTTGAPVGEYRLYFSCGSVDLNCSAKGILSTQQP